MGIGKFERKKKYNIDFWESAVRKTCVPSSVGEVFSS